MEKRGQLTVFVVISIAIIVIISLFFLFSKTQLSLWNNEKTKLSQFIEVCLRQTCNQGVFKISSKGGYYNSPENSLESGIPIYYEDEKIYFPSNEFVEKELARYVEDNLDSCLKNFSDFPSLKINSEKITATSKIYKEEVVFSVDYPIFAEKNKNSFELRDWKEIIIPERIGTMLDSAKIISDKNIKKEGICLTCLMNESISRVISIDTLDYDDRTVIYYIQDKKRTLKTGSLSFSFAVRYKEVP